NPDSLRYVPPGIIFISPKASSKLRATIHWMLQPEIQASPCPGHGGDEECASLIYSDRLGPLRRTRRISIASAPLGIEIAGIEFLYITLELLSMQSLKSLADHPRTS